MPLGGRQWETEQREPLEVKCKLYLANRLDKDLPERCLHMRDLERALSYCRYSLPYGYTDDYIRIEDLDNDRVYEKKEISELLNVYIGRDQFVETQLAIIDDQSENNNDFIELYINPDHQYFGSPYTYKLYLDIRQKNVEPKRRVIIGIETALHLYEAIKNITHGSMLNATLDFDDIIKKVEKVHPRMSRDLKELIEKKAEVLNG